MYFIWHCDIHESDKLAQMVFTGIYLNGCNFCNWPLNHIMTSAFRNQWNSSSTGCPRKKGTNFWDDITPIVGQLYLWNLHQLKAHIVYLRYAKFDKNRSLFYGVTINSVKVCQEPFWPISGNQTGDVLQM